MSKVEEYCTKLRGMSDLIPFLLAESGLPGPRGNIELANAVAEVGDEALFNQLLVYNAEIAPVNTPEEFLAFCGVVGLGKLLAKGRMDVLSVLRRCASDQRWRTREGVAMALQRWGDVDMPHLILEMQNWASGSSLEQRAAAAALCEPRLLKEKAHVIQVLNILDSITNSIIQVSDRKSEAFQALKKGLGYCWSVAVAALPEEGKNMIEKWFGCENSDVKWIMRENLKKKRLERMDAAWVERWRMI